jgi:hypothetical protein
MAANYGRPKPGDPLWYREGVQLELICANPECGRWVKRTVGEIAAKSRLPRDMRLEDLLRRLRCDCGRKPVVWGI